MEGITLVSVAAIVALVAIVALCKGRSLKAAIRDGEVRIETAATADDFNVDDTSDRLAA